MRGPRRERRAAAPCPWWFSLLRLWFARVVVPGAGVGGVHVDKILSRSGYPSYQKLCKHSALVLVVDTLLSALARWVRGK